MSMRINKYIAASGFASRRKADLLIESGNVKVNGKVVRDFSYQVEDGDKVEINGRPVLGAQKKVYLLFNKPLGCVTTVADQFERLTVMDYITDVDERIFPVGRLDYNTSGLLILTNDGQFAYKVTHPKHELGKTYRVRVEGIMSDVKASKLRQGVDIGGFVTSPAKVTLIKGGKNWTELDITIHEGKNRQVRKMMAAVGHKVISLERIAIGDIKIGHLSEGHYRKLSQAEINYLLGETQLFKTAEGSENASKQPSKQSKKGWAKAKVKKKFKPRSKAKSK